MSGPAIVVARNLPANPLAAAAQFYAQIVPLVRDGVKSAGHVIVWFSPADHTHENWRLAAVQELAREAVPARINAIVDDGLDGADGQAAAATIKFLDEAPGITGQICQIDGNVDSNSGSNS